MGFDMVMRAEDAINENLRYEFLVLTASFEYTNIKEYTNGLYVMTRKTFRFIRRGRL